LLVSTEAENILSMKMERQAVIRKYRSTASTNTDDNNPFNVGNEEYEKVKDEIHWRKPILRLHS